MREVAARSVGLASPSLTLDPGMDTFPKLAQGNARRHAGQGRHPREGARHLAGLHAGASTSRRRRDHRARAWRRSASRAATRTAIVGDNRPELYWAVLATQALGGVPVPLYQDSIEKELQYIVDHAEARFAVVEDQEQVDKLLRIRAQCPHLEHVVYNDARGMRHYQDAEPHEPGEPARARTGIRREHPGDVRGRDREGARPTTSRSSATRRARPACPRARCCRTQSDRDRPERRGARGAVGGRRGDPVVPADGVGGRPHVLVRAVDRRRASRRTARRARPRCCRTSRRSARPTSSRRRGSGRASSPRVMLRIEDSACAEARAGPLLPRPRAEHGAAAAGAASRIALGDAAALSARPRPRLRAAPRQPRHAAHPRAYTAGEAIGPEIFVFFRALGINVKQLYGMTEASVFVAIQRDGDVRLDTVGTPVPGVEMRISRGGRGAVPEPRRVPGLLQEPRGDARRR